MMRGVMLDVPVSLLDERRRKGIDKFDEMWEGVVHMTPAPNIKHQDFEFELEAWLRNHWAARSSGDVFHNVNVSDRENWEDNFRIPDLVLLLPEQRAILRDTHILGAPLVVVEIRSPGDESFDKLPFYAQLGVSEMWIIDRDTNVPELFVLSEGRNEPAMPGEDGWLVSNASAVEFKSVANAKFGIRLAEEPASYRELPGR